MDVKTTFLNGFLKEELYMMQPEGFVNPKGANEMCKIQQSIYGLVQASRSWNVRFDELIESTLLLEMRVIFVSTKSFRFSARSNQLSPNMIPKALLGTILKQKQ